MDKKYSKELHYFFAKLHRIDFSNIDFLRIYNMILETNNFVIF